MKLIETFLADPWREKEDAYPVDSHGRERPAMSWLRGYVRGVKGPAK